MAEIPAEQRSGGDAWKWILGFLVLLFTVWILSGVLSNGVDNDPIVPPQQEEPAPEEPQPEPPPEQEEQQETPPEEQSDASSSVPSEQGAMPLHRTMVPVFWPAHLTAPYSTPTD